MRALVSDAREQEVIAETFAAADGVELIELQFGGTYLFINMALLNLVWVIPDRWRPKPPPTQAPVAQGTLTLRARAFGAYPAAAASPVGGAESWVGRAVWAFRAFHRASPRSATDLPTQIPEDPPGPHPARQPALVLRSALVAVEGP